MDSKRFFLVGFGVSLMALAECNKSEPATSAATSEKDVKTITKEAVATVAAKVEGNSVPLVSEGLSPSFRAVTSHLDVGGASFSYAETTPSSSWASMLDEVVKTLPESERKDMPANFSFATLFDILGLNSVTAIGSSSRLRTDGSYHSRAFAHTPGGRKGLATLSGGAASKLLLLDVAPKDTDLALEFSLDIKDFVKDALPKILEMIPAKERAEAQAKLDEPIQPLGITLREILDKLDVRQGLFLKVDPTQKVTLDPNSPPVPATDGVLVIDGLGWLIEKLKPQFMPMLQSPALPINVVDEGGVLTVRAKMPLGQAPMDYQPALRYDAKTGRILVASKLVLFDEVTSGPGKFSQREDFAEVWRDLPQEGNDCIFVSKRLLQAFTDLVATLPDLKGSQKIDNPELAAKMMGWLKPYLSRSQALVLANQADGTSTTSNMSFSVNPSILTTLTAISILSSLALPTFAKVQEKGNETKQISNAKNLAIELKLYATDHGGKYPDKLDDLKVNDSSILQFTDPTTKVSQAWIYNARLTDSSAGTEILIVSPPLPDGKRVAAFNDGSAKVITAGEYAAMKAKW